MLENKQAEVLWYLNILDTGEQCGYRMAVFSLLLPEDAKEIQEMDRYLNLDVNIWKWKSLEEFTEWFKWETSLINKPLYTIYNLWKEDGNFYTKKEVMILFKEYGRIGIEAKIQCFSVS